MCKDPHLTRGPFSDTEKKVEPKKLHPGAVLVNGTTLKVGAVFSLIIMSSKKIAPPTEGAPFKQG